MLKNDRDNSYQGPAVQVGYYDTAFNYRLIQEVVLGVEEEKIPCMLVRIQSYETSNLNVEELAYDLACKSTLAVSVCIGPDCRIALHHNKLPKEFPYIIIENNEYCIENARLIGINAGRIVKNLPLREFMEI